MLGRAVAATLSARGDDVTVMQRRPAGLPVREVLADLADADGCARAVRGQDAVIHLAAKVDVVGPWSRYQQTNVDGTAILLAAGRRAGIGRFVYVSSPAVAHAGQPLIAASARPADPDTARGSYARSKALAELATLAANGPDLHTVAIRPHLVWGPGDTQLVARVVERTRAGRMALVGHGAALIDTTYVTNAAEAIIAGLDRCPQLSGLALVVSNGEPRPIAEIVARVCRAAGLERVPHRVPYSLAWTAGAALDAAGAVLDAAGAVLEASGAPRRWAGLYREPPITRFLAEQLGTAHWFDQRRTRELLEWEPRIDLATGFDRLRDWYAAQPVPTG